MIFPSTKSLNVKIRLEGTGKEWVVMGTKFYSGRCVACRTINFQILIVFVAI